ncbi:MAG: DMT family transporter, partial [Pseudomonadota bacterium]
SQIIWASLFGALFFSELPSQSTIVGAAIIIASGVFIVLREGGGKVETRKPVLNTRSRPEIGTFPRDGLLTRRKKEPPKNGG